MVEELYSIVIFSISFKLVLLIVIQISLSLSLFKLNYKLIYLTLTYFQFNLQYFNFHLFQLCHFVQFTPTKMDCLKKLKITKANDKIRWNDQIENNLNLMDFFFFFEKIQLDQKLTHRGGGSKTHKSLQYLSHQKGLSFEGISKAYKVLLLKLMDYNC